MLMQILDYVGVAVFAVSGCIAASRKGLDITALIFFGVLTGIGGGTLRDLILGVPVFWVVSSSYLAVCLAISVIVWFTADSIEKLGKPLRWADAIGIAAYSVMGAGKAVQLGHSPLVAVLMGISTATFGGVLRDMVANEPSAIIKQEIYVSAAAVGASFYVTLYMVGVDPWFAAGIAGAFALGARGGAILYGWSLPGYGAPKTIVRWHGKKPHDSDKPDDDTTRS
ncbi:MAG: trimeric intracellular cation channel family protein [Rhodobacteraceae bacterium]|nr:trimeric intracellular cation channel family protein [Paracoccaceae bacterium]